ncbi:hypothetical protein BR93DRAFT_284270 [Coniochaeta sp. PMI_546]|nr:hypothetical protein BR93DRAFT_284270 [Coniochaeta sp. PMI_546]
MRLLRPGGWLWNHQGDGATIRVSAYKPFFKKQGSSVFAIWMGVGGEVWRRAATFTHTCLLLRIQFLYARCNSQQAQLVSVRRSGNASFPLPMAADAQSDRLFSSSVSLVSIFSSALSLSRAFSSQSRSALCRSHQASTARVEETPDVLYNNNLESVSKLTEPKKFVPCCQTLQVLRISLMLRLLVTCDRYYCGTNLHCIFLYRTSVVLVVSCHL